MAFYLVFAERRQFSAHQIGMSENEVGHMCLVRHEPAFPQAGHGKKTLKHIAPRWRRVCLKPAVAHDAGIARYLDENVFKTKLEAERPVFFHLSR